MSGPWTVCFQHNLPHRGAYQNSCFGAISTERLAAAWGKGVLFKLRLVLGCRGQESARAAYLSSLQAAGRRLAGLGIGGSNLCVLTGNEFCIILYPSIVFGGVVCQFTNTGVLSAASSSSCFCARRVRRRPLHAPSVEVVRSRKLSRCLAWAGQAGATGRAPLLAVRWLLPEGFDARRPWAFEEMTDETERYICQGRFA
jgi:hypothetical protein